MNAYGNNGSYNSNEMNSRPDSDSHEPKSYSSESRNCNSGRETNPASSMCRPSCRGEMDINMSSSHGGGDDFESAASREGRTTTGTDSSSFDGRAGSAARDSSYDSSRSAQSEDSQRSENSFGLQKESAGFGAAGRDSEFASSDRAGNSNSFGSSEGAGMRMGHGSRKSESFVDKAIDGAADYAKRKW